jgi:hypothetical protein
MSHDHWVASVDASEGNLTAAFDALGCRFTVEPPVPGSRGGFVVDGRQLAAWNCRADDGLRIRWADGDGWYDIMISQTAMQAYADDPSHLDAFIGSLKKIVQQKEGRTETDEGMVNLYMILMRR